MHASWSILSPATWPLYVLFLVSVGSVLLSIRAGFHMGRVRRGRSESAPEGPIGSVIGAVLGLLAFMLAFTFNIAANRFDTRKQLLLDEVNAIGTVALRAELLPEPYGTQCLNLIKRYVDVRAGISADTQSLANAIRESEAIQDQLWRICVELARGDVNTPVGSLFVSSLNSMFDLHTSRVTVANQYRILPVIWLVLACLTVFSMAGVGYQFGVVNRSSFSAHLILAFSFSLVVLLIVDLDRAISGNIRVSQQPMLDLQTKLAAMVVPPEKAP